jgi:NitT/TauT family transport system substrate-binding protein
MFRFNAARMIGAAVVLTCLLAACTGGGDGDTTDADAGSSEPIKLVVAMGHEAPYPGEEAVLYAIPKQLGLFGEANIDVEYQPTAGSGVAVQLVQAGQADLGQGNPSAVFSAIDKGAAIKVVYNIIPRYGSGLAVTESSDISSPDDLNGKTIGVASLASSRLLDAKQMVKAAGLDPEKDVQYVAVGVGAQAASALTSGNVDGLYLWDAAYESMKLSGTELRVIKDVFPNSDKVLDFVEFASEDAIESKGEALEKLGRAAVIAQMWAQQNPEEALDMFYEEFPTVRKNDEAGRAQDLAILRFTLNQFDPSRSDGASWGDTPKDAVEHTAEFLKSGGLVQDVLPYEEYVASQFVEAYNDVSEADVAQVQK